MAQRRCRPMQADPPGLRPGASNGENGMDYIVDDEDAVTSFIGLAAGGRAASFHHLVAGRRIARSWRWRSGRVSARPTACFIP